MKSSLIAAIIVIVIMAPAFGVDVYSQPPRSDPTNSSGENQANPKECIKAGQTTPDMSSCCSNLVRIFVAYYNPVRSCKELSEKSTLDSTIDYICSAWNGHYANDGSMKDKWQDEQPGVHY